MIHEHDDAAERCTWHNPQTGERCDAKPVMGNPKHSLCAEHVVLHRRLTQEPDSETSAEA